MSITEKDRNFNLKNIQLPERTLWSKIKQRCYNSKSCNYKNYGGRGITMCDEWLHDFKAFHDYIGNRPSSKYSLDRIDNNKGYEPGNVRWATIHEQCANRRTNNKIVGISYKKANHTWIASLTFNHVKVLDKSFKKYDDAVEARRQSEIYFIK